MKKQPSKPAAAAKAPVAPVKATAKPAKPVKAGPDRTLAEYRETFGVLRGSVFYTDGIKFADACIVVIKEIGAKLQDCRAERDLYKRQAEQFETQLLQADGSGDG